MRGPLAARVFGIAAIVVGAIALGLAVAAVGGGLAEGGFHGALIGLIVSPLFFCPALALLFLGRRALDKAQRTSN
jgi:uncharacterized membrane protein YvlD (DUF360 family)